MFSILHASLTDTRNVGDHLFQQHTTTEWLEDEAKAWDRIQTTSLTFWNYKLTLYQLKSCHLNSRPLHRTFRASK